MSYSKSLEIYRIDSGNRICKKCQSKIIDMAYQTKLHFSQNEDLSDYLCYNCFKQDIINNRTNKTERNGVIYYIPTTTSQFFCCACKKSVNGYMYTRDNDHRLHFLCKECYSWEINKGYINLIKSECKNTKHNKKTTETIKINVANEKQKYPKDYPQLVQNNTIIENSKAHSIICTGYKVISYCGYNLYKLKCSSCGSIYTRNGNLVQEDIKAYEKSKIIESTTKKIKENPPSQKQKNDKNNDLTQKRVDNPVEKRELRKYNVSRKDVLIRASVNRCHGERHILEDVILCVKVLSGDKAKIIEIPGTYCLTCNKYFLLEDNYYKLRQYGIPMCTITYNYQYSSEGGIEFQDMNEKSILRILGYTVNVKDNLSKEYRWEILTNAVENDILTCGEICSHLDFLINRSYYMDNMESAISKWEIDRTYISNYKKKNLRRIEVVSLSKNIYKNK